MREVREVRELGWHSDIYISKFFFFFDRSLYDQWLKS